MKLFSQGVLPQQLNTGQIQFPHPYPHNERTIWILIQVHTTWFCTTSSLNSSKAVKWSSHHIKQLSCSLSEAVLLCDTWEQEGKNHHLRQSFWHDQPFRIIEAVTAYCCVTFLGFSGSSLVSIIKQTFRAQDTTLQQDASTMNSQEFVCSLWCALQLSQEYSN